MWAYYPCLFGKVCYLCVCVHELNYFTGITSCISIPESKSLQSKLKCLKHRYQKCAPYRSYSGWYNSPNGYDDLLKSDFNSVTSMCLYFVSSSLEELTKLYSSFAILVYSDYDLIYAFKTQDIARYPHPITHINTLHTDKCVYGTTQMVEFLPKYGLLTLKLPGPCFGMGGSLTVTVA